MPKYSVIIPVYNVESYLPECIDSVLAQDTSDDYEIILIDDGSPDGSGAICDRYASEHPHIRVFHDTNHGVSHARNRGIDMAQGEYVLFLDADDLWEPALLQTVERLTDGNVDVLFFEYYSFDACGKIERRGQPLLKSGASGEEYLQQLFARDSVPNFYPWCYVYRRVFLNEHQIRFREDLKVSEDFDFNMRVFTSARHVEGTDEQLYGYRIRIGSVTATLSEKKLMDNLTTKAVYFRRYPVPAMADLYAENAVLAAEIPASDTVERFLKENRDIWSHVSAAAYKLGRLFVLLFGDRNGARAYYAVRNISRKLRRRS